VVARKTESADVATATPEWSHYLGSRVSKRPSSLDQMAALSQISVRSAKSSASSTSTPRYRTVFSILE
jgi:hypothetical protein